MTLSTLLLAEGLRVDQRLESLRRGFNPNLGDEMRSMMWVLATCIIACLVLLMLARVAERARPRQHTGPQKPADLFSRAADIVGLTRQEQRLVRRLAEHGGVAQPTALLLTPACFASCARAAQHAEPDPNRDVHARDLGVRLFGVNPLAAPEPRPAGADAP